MDNETIFGIPLGVFGTLTPTSLLLLCGALIMFGKLVPKPLVNDRMKDKDELLSDYRQRNANLYAAVELLLKQNDLLIRSSEEATHRLTHSLPTVEEIVDVAVQEQEASRPSD